MTATMPISHAERERRHAVAVRFVSTAVDGDVEGFLRNTMEIDWPGAWLQIFRMLGVVPRICIGDEIRAAFLAAWRGTQDHDVDAGIAWSGELLVGSDWTLTKDLSCNIDLLVRCLIILMPGTRPANPPSVLYRGQSLSEHKTGSHGVWWTTSPIFAESFARGPFRAHVGQGAVVVALNPDEAIIYRLNRFEFLLDPSKLTDVRLLDVPPRNTQLELEMSQLERDLNSRLLGIPASGQTAVVSEWLDLGMPLAGIPSCREARTDFIMSELATQKQSLAA